MVTEVVSEGHSEARSTCFFAYLDILGFKNMVKRSTIHQLRAVVESFVSACAECIDKSRRIETNTGRVLSRIKLGSGINVLIVSDSIYVWTENDERLKQFDDLLHIVNALLARGFENGLPLRGVVTYGELFSGNIKTDKDIPLDFAFGAGSVYGRALVDAYELECQMNWSGAILTPRGWAKVIGEFEQGKRDGVSVIMRSENIKCAEELFNHFPYLLWYDAPFKNGRRNVIAYNWNYRPGLVLSVDKIHGAFTGRCDMVDDAVKTKLHETIQFYEYSQRAMELCELGLKDKLPVAATSYVLSNF